MDQSEDPPHRPGIEDIPRLLRNVADRAVDVANARLELIRAEINEEAEKRLRRLPYVIVPSVFLVLGFAILNVALVSWLAEAVGTTRSAFIFAAVYMLIGAAGLWWFRRTGGLNPPDEEAGEEPVGRGAAGAGPERGGEPGGSAAGAGSGASGPGRGE